MSYTLNLGSNFPYADGTIIEDISIYLGNNKFFRLLSQSNNSKTMAGIYQVDDVYSSTPNITTIHEQVIAENFLAQRVRMVKLGNGSVMVIHRPSVDTIYLSYFVIKYDETLGEFVIETDLNERFYVDGNSPLYNMTYNIDDGLSYIDNRYHDNYLVTPYGQNSALILSNDNSGYFNVGIIKNVYGTTDVEKDCILLTRNTTSDNYFYPDYTNVNIIDNVAYITLSNYQYYTTYHVDLINDQMLISNYSNSGDILKMDNDRYLYTQAYGTEVRYSLSSQSTLYPSSDVRFEPNVYAHNGTNPAMQYRWNFPLDRFHCIHFRQTAATTISAYVLKILDENYGYVSPATQGGATLLTDIIFSISSSTSRDNRMSVMSDGQWIKQIDSTKFYIQTNKNIFKFFEISPSPAQ